MSNAFKRIVILEKDCGFNRLKNSECGMMYLEEYLESIPSFKLKQFQYEACLAKNKYIIEQDYENAALLRSFEKRAESELHKRRLC